MQTMDLNPKRYQEQRNIHGISMVPKTFQKQELIIERPQTLTQQHDEHQPHERSEKRIHHHQPL